MDVILSTTQWIGYVFLGNKQIDK